MATVTGLTKERMLAIEAASVVGGTVDTNGHLVLEKNDGTFIDAGNVKGATGEDGTPAPVTTFIRDPTNAVDIPSSFGMGLTIGTAGSDMPYTFATVETVYMNINRGVQKVTDKETGRVIWRTAISGVWSEWRYLQDRGTSAERDAIYGVPATDAEKVALANKEVRWHNTQYGWDESYYAPSGTTGLTVLGLVSFAPAGWYPMGPGPEITLEPSAVHAATAGVTIGGWNGYMRRRGGASWFSVPTDLGVRIMVAGHYDLSWWTIQQAGSGNADYHTRLIDAAGTPTNWMSNVAGTSLSSTLLTRTGALYHSVLVRPGNNFRVVCLSGALNIHNVTGGTTDPSARGQMHVRYVRPPLVSS